MQFSLYILLIFLYFLAVFFKGKKVKRLFKASINWRKGQKHKKSRRVPKPLRLFLCFAF